MRISVRVTSQGSPYGRFRRALERREPMAALSAAAELRHVALSDALELVLLLRDRDHPGIGARCFDGMAGSAARFPGSRRAKQVRCSLFLLRSRTIQPRATRLGRSRSSWTGASSTSQARILIRWADDSTRGVERSQHRRRIEP